MIGSVNEVDRENEIRAIEKLCTADTRRLLVQVFHHQAAMGLPQYLDTHEVDMELCLKNLKDEINSQNSTVRDVLEQMTTTEKHTTTFHQLSKQLATNVENINVILIHVLEGLEFIHSNSEVHRDLKPENGPFPTTNVLMLVLFSYIHRRWKIDIPRRVETCNG